RCIKETPPEPGWLRRPLRSRDTLLMAEALRAMGVGIEETVSSDSAAPGSTLAKGGEAWRIIPSGLRGPATVDVGNAGTVMRFLPPLATLADGDIRFDGDPRSYERPLHGVIDALRALGARPRLPSMPHIRMTVDMLRRVGAQVDEPESGGEPNVWRVTPGALLGRDLTVEPDLSNAQPFLAAALVTGGRVVVPDWPAHTTQPGDRLREIFTTMGGSCELT
ncbi:3-phosphoshikimate 1-carboxyvinyltransferase, partial [Streptomyces sp. NRRL F-6602]